MSRQSGFRADVRDAVHVSDLALLALPALAMVGVFVLPDATTAGFALHYEDPTLLAMYASNFLHRSLGHLLGNLAAYLLVAPLVYLLCVLGGRRGLFLASFGTFLLVLPWVLSALNVVLARPRVGFGFSGVTLAFFGLLPSALLTFIDSQFTDDVGIRHSPVLFFAGATLIGVLALPSLTGPSFGVTAVAALATARYGQDIRDELTTLSLEGFRNATVEDGGFLELGVSALVVFLCFLFVAFPSDPASRGAVVNLYVHLLGYCLGYLSPFCTAFLAGRIGYGQGMDV
ncbi:hypothetical protein [Halarchaeum sp. P4]|uniref:hypothetical protein n=1 Tax=Halarchaeum sp. P4 TaxID=3421639 RepID=UPI003EBAC8E0